VHRDGEPLLLDPGTGSDADGMTSTRFIQRQANRDTLVATVTVSPGLSPQVTLKIEPRLRFCLGDGTCIDSL
jgi:hypothetical protein